MMGKKPIRPLHVGVDPEKSSPDDYRLARYRLIRVALKQLGIDDDAYRDMMNDLFGQRSATDMTIAQLNDLVDHLKSRGFKPTHGRKPGGGPAQQANTGEQAKIRALWISLWHLGVVRDNSDAALAAFCARVTGGKQTGLKALQWIHGHNAVKAIEALKDWACREAGVDWSPYQLHGVGVPVTLVHNERARVIEAQWRRLYALGVVRIDGAAAIGDYLHRPLRLACRKSQTHFTDAEADNAIRLLGGKIRKAMEAQKE